MEFDFDDGGMILIDKPAGITSFGVVARVRRVLCEKAGKKVKVGHTGTLDPFATGLLILMYGKWTKKCVDFLKADKKYEAIIQFGYKSSTGDPEGEIEKVPGVVNREQVERMTKEMIGESVQKVPKFSAVKIRGMRAYEMARDGKEFDTPVRKIIIYDLRLVDFDEKKQQAKISCLVSSGTYIRTLAEDLARKCGTDGYLTQLRRTKIGESSVEDAKKLEDFGITS